MRAILIETDKQTVREVEFGGKLEDAYKLLDVSLIEGVYIQGHVIYVDEEGLLTPKTIQKGWFKWETYRQPLAGRGLIVGNGIDDWESATMTIKDAIKGVTWC